MIDRPIRWRPAEIALCDFRLTSRSGDVSMLPSQLLNSVFFLYAQDGDGNLTGPFGTGAFIAFTSEKFPKLRHLYAVSNHHIVHRNGASVIRLNTSNGQHRFIKLEPHEWHRMMHDDLAAVDITDRVSADGDDIAFVKAEWLLTKKFIEDFQVGVGDDVVMIGMLARSEGNERNEPVARFGSIARIASDRNKVPHEDGHYCEAHICDMRSRSGFSGSPVFVYRVFDKSLHFILGPVDIETHETVFRTFFKIFGLHFGQFNEPTTAKLSEARSMRDGDKFDIPSGLTTVAPSWRISEMLNHKALVAQRTERDELGSRKTFNDKLPILEFTSTQAPVAQKAEGADETSSANPSHREDFMRLADAAARKKPQA